MSVRTLHAKNVFEVQNCLDRYLQVKQDLQHVPSPVVGLTQKELRDINELKDFVAAVENTATLDQFCDVIDRDYALQLEHEQANNISGSKAIAHKFIMLEARLLYCLDYVEDAKEVLKHEKERAVAEGVSAHGEVSMMLASIYAEEQSFDEAIRILQEVNKTKDQRKVVNESGYDAARMLSIVRTQHSQYTNEQLKHYSRDIGSPS
jgi:hypothetical protein